MDEARSVAIFRIFQETLTNIIRHADATRVRVSLKKNATAVEMKVSDNGKGISRNRLSGPESFGLIGMRERAHSFGGNLVITGARGEGTTVAVTIPIHKKGANG